jgi:hypothetical protein
MQDIVKLSIVMLSVIIMSMVMLGNNKFRYVECHYAVFNYANCRSVKVGLIEWNV